MTPTRASQKQVRRRRDPLRVLVLEHAEADAELCLMALRQSGLEVEADVVSTREEFMARLPTRPFDAVISDYRLPGFSGIEALDYVRANWPDLPFIIMTGTLGEESAVDVMKRGATDYVLKDRLERLPLALQRAVDERASQNARRAAEQRFRSLVDNAIYGIYTCTVDGRFLSANAALVQMLGYDSEEELIGRNIDRDIYADPEGRSRLLARHAGAERIQGVEVEWKRKDGGPITVRLSGRPVRDEAGKVVEFDMFVEDVTSQGMIEDRLRQVQKMEAMGELTGGIAHDFNNLLTIISSNAELIEDDLPAEFSSVRAELSELKAAARRGSAMVRKLLTFSRKASLEVEQVDILDVARDTANLLRRFLPESIELQLNLGDGPFVVLADPSAIEQILINLATNARDAMPAGGKLTISIQAVDLDDVRLTALGANVGPGRFVCLEVEDTGTGMDARTRERMFEPFFTTKPPSQGTGLGMAMVYGLVKEHNGFIGVYSELGRGTSIRTYLPFVAGPAVLAVPEPARPRGGTETILLAEDEEMIRGSARRILERLGYRVVLAEDGEEALRILRSGEPRIDLVVSDVVMPRRSGRQLLEAVRQEGNRVPFIFTSGYSALDAREAATLDNTVPFLSKPWTAGDMTRLVRSVLDAARNPD